MRRKSAPMRLRLEPLEERLCLATSVGWDGPGRGGAALTYYIGAAPSSLTQAAVDAAIKTALNVWSSVARLTFAQTSQANQVRSLDFTFQPIDGSGGTLAQGNFPADVNPARIAGDVQFDSSEQWEIGNARGGEAYDLVRTAVHEIGHALGLDHTKGADSVMAPTASPDQSFTGLAPTDVKAIRALYAPARATTGVTVATQTLSRVTKKPMTTTHTTNPFSRFRFPQSWIARNTGSLGA